jgi:hypothetical protein
MVDAETCPQCQRPLIEIDHYGERLIGCIECNRWGLPGSEHLFMALPEDNLQALSNLSNALIGLMGWAASVARDEMAQEEVASRVAIPAPLHLCNH